MSKTKLTSLFFAIFILLASCSTSKQARTYERTIDGTWQLQTVETQGITGQIKARVFNEEDFNCFIGSTWKFNKGNNLGSYNISKNGGECVAIKRDIRWSIYEPISGIREFQFKRLDTNLKEIANDAGFRFTILQLNTANMQLRNEFPFEGKTAAFIYNFVRIN